jgi:glycosyltransferase involved in cell wall biosynthesis
MKVLIYTHEFPPFLGGLAKTSFMLASGFSEAGLDVIVLAPRYSDTYKEIDSEYKFRIKRMTGLSRNHGIPSPLPEAVGMYSLYTAMRKYRPDALLLITREGQTSGGLLRDYPLKVIVRVAGYEPYRYLLGKKLYNKLLGKPIKRLYMKASRIVSPSHSTRELLELSGISSDKIEVIYNGVGNDMLSHKVDTDALKQLRAKLNLNNEDKLILTVSRLVPSKGHKEVIRSLPRLLKEFENLKYLIVGEGGYEEELRNLAYEEGVLSNVIFAGPVTYNKVRDYLDLSYLFAMPNTVNEEEEGIEGLPNVVFEAMARGKPLVVGTEGGAKEIVEHGVNGFVEDGNNMEKIYEHILELLKNEKKAKIFGENSRRKIEQGFTEDKMIEKYLKIIYDQ